LRLLACHRAESPEEDEEKSTFGKIFHYAIALPCTIIRNISIPPSSEENWSRIRASIFPLPALGVLCLFFESKLVLSQCIVHPKTLTGALILAACILFCVLLSLCIYCTTHMVRAPQSLIVPLIITRCIVFHFPLIHSFDSLDLGTGQSSDRSARTRGYRGQFAIGVLGPDLPRLRKRYARYQLVTKLLRYFHRCRIGQNGTFRNGLNWMCV